MFRLKEGQQEVGGVIADSFSLVRHSWVPNLLVILVGLLVSAGILFLGGFIVKDALMAIITAAKTAQDHHQVFSFTAVMPGKDVQIIMLVCIILTLWVARITKAVLARSCWNVATTGTARLGNAFRVGLRYCLVYLVQMMVVGLLVTATYVIQYYLSKFNLPWVNTVGAIATQLLLYYVVVKLILVDASAVVDECGFRGFVRSWRFTRSNWWRTIATLVLSAVFYVMFLILLFEGISTLVLVPGVTPIFSDAHALGQVMSPLWFAILTRFFGVLTGLSILFTLPTMVGSSQVVLYNDLKNRRRRDYL